MAKKLLDLIDEKPPKNVKNFSVLELSCVRTDFFQLAVLKLTTTTLLYWSEII